MLQKLDLPYRSKKSSIQRSVSVFCNKRIFQLIRFLARSDCLNSTTCAFDINRNSSVTTYWLELSLVRSTFNDSKLMFAFSVKNLTQFSSYVECFKSIYHTNMDRLSITPTRSLIRHAIFSQTRTCNLYSD